MRLRTLSFFAVMEMKSLTKKKEDSMSNNPNFRNPKNGNPMQGTGGSTGGNNASGSPEDRKLSPMEKKIRAKAEEILEKLCEIYGDIGRFNKAELAEIIYYHFGNPLKAILEKPDPIRDALQQMYGPPISQRSY
jgi:hypothetical protein